MVGSSRPRKGTLIKDGWAATSISQDVQNKYSDKETTHPILEQIHNVEHMIREALSFGKREEVDSLLENLNELKAEYKKYNVNSFTRKSISFDDQSKSNILHIDSVFNYVFV